MPVTMEEIDRQLDGMDGFDRWLTKKEINYLPKVINEGETIKGMTSGLYDGNTWLIVATTQRLLFLDKGLIYGLKQMEMPLNQITSLTHRTGIMLGNIEVDTAGGKKKINMIPNKDVVKFSDIVSSLIKQEREKIETHQTNPNQEQSGNVIEKLKELAKLYNNGVLTEEEFQKQKQKIME